MDAILPVANPFGIDMSSLEEAGARLRDFNDKIVESSKTVGGTALDAYEKAVDGLVSLEEKVAGASQIEWVSAMAQTHAQIVRQVSGAYSKATRELLSV